MSVSFTSLRALIAGTIKSLLSSLSVKSLFGTWKMLHNFFWVNELVNAWRDFRKESLEARRKLEESSPSLGSNTIQNSSIDKGKNWTDLEKKHCKDWTWWLIAENEREIKTIICPWTIMAVVMKQRNPVMSLRSVIISPFFFLILVICVYYLLVYPILKLITSIYLFKAFAFIDLILYCLFIVSFYWLKPLSSYVLPSAYFGFHFFFFS